jgi:LCP family protein required for cell wall assembly
LTPGPPRVGLGLIKRAAIAGVLIVVLTAAAVSSAAFLQVDDIIAVVEREGRAPILVPDIDRVDAGSPRTVMILGSDKRFGDKGKPRSDTIILVRLNPDREAVSVLSIPRDLKVTIPGYEVPTKINGAFEQGGPALTLRTLKKVLSTPERPFRINHVVQMNFSGFQRAINYVGCVYYDVDQRYFNDNAQGQNYAAIDIKPGYQRICGGDSLAFVRYRHTDNDLVRAARQQDFLRQIKNQKGVGKLKDPTNIKELAKVFSRYLDSDAGLRKRKTLFSVAKLAIFSSNKPVLEVPFRITGEEADGAYLLSSDAAIKRTVDEFMRAKVASNPATSTASRRRATTAKARRAAASKRRRAASTRGVPGLSDARREGEDQVLIAEPKVDFPLYFPTLKRDGAVYDGGLSSEPTTRTYSIRDERGKLHRAYRLTFRVSPAGFREYYGVQGTTWREPPLLDDPTERRTVNGRRLSLYYDGRRLRMVAWRTPRAVYWVSNTLLRKLSNRQMLVIAGSLSRLGAK